jgi:hypothetical protein
MPRCMKDVRHSDISWNLSCEGQRVVQVTSIAHHKSTCPNQQLLILVHLLAKAEAMETCLLFACCQDPLTNVV